MAVAAPLNAQDIASLEAAGLGHIGAKVRALLDRQTHDRHQIEWRDAMLEKLTFEMARSGQHPRSFLRHGTDRAWKGGLVCDDYSGYKALFLDRVITEVGCMAHARRKFVELRLANKNALAATAIELIGQL